MQSVQGAQAIAEPTTISPPKKQFNIAFSTDSYPYQFIDDQGKPAGVMKDVWSLWANKQGVEVNFVTGNWHQTLEAVLTRKVDFHAGLIITDERRPVFGFTDKIFPEYSFIYLHKSLTLIDNVKQLTPYKVGVIKGSSHNATLVSANNKIKLELFEDRQALYEAALNNELMAFADLDSPYNGYDKITQLKALFPKFRRLHYFSSVYVGAVSKRNQELLPFINQGLAQITSKELSEIEERWLKSDRVENTLNLGFAVSLSPYMDYSNSGQAQGLFIDIWRLWSRYNDIEVNFVGDTMARINELVKTGGLDVQIALPASDITLPGLTKAIKIYQSLSKVFVLNDYPDITSMEQLGGHTVGLFQTSPYIEELKAKYPQIKLSYFADHREMLRAAENRQVSAVIAEVENMQVKLVNANLQSLFHILDAPVFDIDIFSLVTVDNPKLAEFIQIGFDKIPVEELQKLETAWLADGKDGYFQAQNTDIELSPEQKSWLRAHPILTVGISSDWAPMEFIDEHGQQQGINKDIIETVATSVGLGLEFKAYDNWNSLFNAFRQEDVDVLLGISSDEDRKALMEFSDVYWQMPWSIIYPQSFNQVKSLKEFYGKSLALVRGYRLIEWLKENHPNIAISIVDNVEQGILAVQQGLVDGFVEALPVAARHVKRESIVPLAIAVVPEIPPESNRIGVHKDDLTLLSIINSGLTVISDKTRAEIFNRWFDVNIQTGLDQRFVTKIAAQVGFVIFIVIIIVLFWNRKLHQEVAARKKLELKMKHMATHDELTGLANRTLMKSQMATAIAMHQRQSLNLAVLFVDLDGFKAINDAHGHEVGDKVLQQVSTRLIECVRKSDTVCRFGGDEFVILLTGLNSKAEAAYIAEKIIESIERPFEVSDTSSYLGASIGIAMFPDDGDSATELLKIADTLMYRVKSSGKNNFMHR
ncbi:transporter substrate-binding domain-containing protein [Colwellia sp. MEBiC06753]